MWGPKHYTLKFVDILSASGVFSLLCVKLFDDVALTENISRIMRCWEGCEE